SLKNGTQSMSDALVARLPESSRRLNAHIEAVKPESGKWLVVSRGRTEEFDGVILSAPAYASGNFLRADFPQLGSELNEIRYSSSVTVALGYDERVLSSLPAGFGFLVPRTEG